MKLTRDQKRIRKSALFLALEKLVSEHRKGARVDDETALADIVGDLRHVADKLGADWDEVLRRAEDYYGEETREETYA